MVLNLEMEENEAVVRRDLVKIKYFVIDCDGVLWHESSPIPGAADAIQRMKDTGREVLLVTNNSSKTREEYRAKCSKMGFDMKQEEIVCTAYVTAYYLKHDLNVTSKVYVIGSRSLCAELKAAGINHLPVGPDPVAEDENMESWGATPLEDGIGAVVVGFDQFVSYKKVLKAASYLKDPECHYIATNEDAVFPLEGSKVCLPGTGSIVAMVTKASGRQPVVMGKPSESLQAYFHHLIPPDVDSDSVLVIGDRLDTDIKLAHNCDYKSLAVLTGIVSKQNIEKLSAMDEMNSKGLLPDYYTPSIADLLKYI